MAKTDGMKKELGWYFPDYEEHLQQWMKEVNYTRNGRICYQAHKYEAALKHIPEPRGVAVDVGGHIGLWSYLMAPDFAEVIAFEPMAIHRRCFAMNLEGHNNVELRPEALGATFNKVSIETRTANSSGDTGVIGDGMLPMIPLDSLNLARLDFLKIDCEGYEANVVKGGMETILRCKPVVVVEQKGDMSKRYGLESLEAVKLLQFLGMKEAQCISGDHIMVWA